MTVNYPLAMNQWHPASVEKGVEVLRSGMCTMGEQTWIFEQDFAAFHDVNHAIMVNSGSSANLIALAALVELDVIGPGDKIAVPAVSWSTTYFPLLQLGLVPCFVDVDAVTMNVNVDKLANYFNANPDIIAMFAVNVLGCPSDLVGLVDLCLEHDVILFEDNCESLGATYAHGKRAGTAGWFGTSSFFYSHHISTIEGGMIVTNDDAIAATCRSLRAHGWLRDSDMDAMYEATQEQCFDRDQYDDFKFAFTFATQGYSVRPTDVSAAIGREELKHLPSYLHARAVNRAKFRKKFDNHPDVMIQRKSHMFDMPSWFGLAMVTRGKLTHRRMRLYDELKKRGIASRPIIAGDFTRQPVMRRLRPDQDFKIAPHLFLSSSGTDYIDKHGLYVGCFNHIMDDDLFEAVEDAIDAAGK